MACPLTREIFGIFLNRMNFAFLVFCSALSDRKRSRQGRRGGRRGEEQRRQHERWRRWRRPHRWSWAACSQHRHRWPWCFTAYFSIIILVPILVSVSFPMSILVPVVVMGSFLVSFSIQFLLPVRMSISVHFQPLFQSTVSPNPCLVSLSVPYAV